MLLNASQILQTLMFTQFEYITVQLGDLNFFQLIYARTVLPHARTRTHGHTPCTWKRQTTE